MPAYEVETVTEALNHEIRICMNCNARIVQRETDEIGTIYFECTCSTWRSIEKDYGIDIERYKFSSQAEKDKYCSKNGREIHPIIKIRHPHINNRVVMMELAECDEFILDDGTKYMEAYDGPCDTMLELGSHVGCSTLFFAAEKGFKRIMAIEAHHENFRNLVRNTFNNQLNDIIRPFWSAVAAKTGEIRSLSWANSGLNHGQYGTFFRSDNHPNAGFVQTIGFEHILSLFDTIDVLKVDIEGSEYEIFSPNNGLKETLKRVRFIELETHAPNDAFFTDKQFAEYGYPHQGTATGILKNFLIDCGFELNFRDVSDGGMQGYNKNFRGKTQNGKHNRCNL